MTRKDRAGNRNMDKPTITTRSNLYDSILREIAKISDYEQINKYVLELDAKRKSLDDLSKAMFKFLMVRHDEVMNDCIVRSFINIHQALKRSKTSVNTRIESVSKENSIRLSTESFGYVTILIDKITKLLKMRQIHNKENEINSIPFNNLVDFIETKFYEANFNNYINIDLNTFETLVNNTYEDIVDFMIFIKVEIEQSVSVYYNSIIMKNMIYVVLTAAMVIEKVVI